MPGTVGLVADVGGVGRGCVPTWCGRDGVQPAAAGRAAVATKPRINTRNVTRGPSDRRESPPAKLRPYLSLIHGAQKARCRRLHGTEPRCPQHPRHTSSSSDSNPPNISGATAAGLATGVALVGARTCGRWKTRGHTHHRLRAGRHTRLRTRRGVRGKRTVYCQHNG